MKSSPKNLIFEAVCDNIIQNTDKNSGNDVTIEDTMKFLEEEAAELHNSGENERKAADNRQTANNSDKGSEDGIACIYHA